MNWALSKSELSMTASFSDVVVEVVGWSNRVWEEKNWCKKEGLSWVFWDWREKDGRFLRALKAFICI